MADGGLPLTPLSPSLLSQLALEYGGTPAIPAVQRSQYLADALHAMSSQGQEIRSPLALGSDLLAEALLHFGQTRQNRALLSQINASQTNLAADAQRGIYPLSDAGEAGAAGGESGAPSSADFFGSGPPSAAAAPPQGNQGLAAALGPGSSPQAHVLADLVAGGLSPVAASGLVGNFTQESGPGLSQNNPGEGAIGMANWEGPRGRAAQQYFAAHGGPTLDNQAAFALQELHGPESAALARLNAATDPTGAAAAGLAYERPAGYRPGGNPADASGWANRQAQANAAYSAFEQSQAPHGGTANTSAGAQASPSPQPFQIATGPDPSVASPGAQGPSGASPFRVAPAASPTGSPGGLQAPAPGPSPVGPGAAPAGPPTGPYATPEESAFIRYGLSHPPGSIQYQAALAKAQEIQQRRMTPLAAPKDMIWDNARQSYVALPGTQVSTVSRGPGGAVQADPFGRLNAVSNPDMGPIPSGTMASNGAGGPQITPIQGGGVRPMSPQERQAYGIPDTDRSVYAVGPDQKPVKIADAPFTPKDLGDRLTKLQGSDQYKLADNATNMYTAAVQAAQRPGGISDVELRDFAARQFSGGVARQFNVEALNNAQGAWANLKQFVPELISGQHMSPPARQALLQAMHDDAVQAQTGFAHLSQSDEAFANSQGMSLRPYLAPLTRELPAIPSLGQIPNGGQFPGQPPRPAAGAVPGAPPGFDPASPNGRAAMGLIHDHGYRFVGGHLVSPQGQVVQ